MKYEESYSQVDAEILALIERVVPDTFVSSLKEGGVDFSMPQDSPMELKVKYDVNEDGGSCTIKVSWDYDVYEEEEEEDSEE